MPDKHIPPSAPAGDTGKMPPTEGAEWASSASSQASYVELAAQLGNADLRLCEMQAHMDGLIDANCRLRAELGEMTLQWVIEKTKA